MCELGNPNGAAAIRRACEDGQALREAVRDNADALAEKLAQVMTEMREAGHLAARNWFRRTFAGFGPGKAGNGMCRTCEIFWKG